MQTAAALFNSSLDMHRKFAGLCLIIPFKKYIKD